MADQATANETPVATADGEPAPDTSPAVAAPPVTRPSAEAVLAAIKAKVHEANKPETPAAKPDEVKGDEPKLNADPKVLRELGKLQQAKRELEAKLKELEPSAPDAAFAKEVRDLWSKGGDSRLEALAKLGGKDGLDVLAEVVQFFYEREQEGGAKDDATTAKPTAETKALLDALTEVKKELAEIKAGKTTDAEATVKAEQERANQYVKGFVGKHAAQFEICARPENIGEAVDLIQAAALEIIKRDRVSVKELKAEDADRIYAEAAGEVEKEYEKTGQRFAKAPKQGSSLFNPDRYARPLSKPTVTLRKIELSKDPKVREEQIRQRALEKLEAGGYGR